MEGLTQLGVYEPSIDLLTTTLSYDPGYLGDEDNDQDPMDTGKGTSDDEDDLMEDDEDEDWDA